MKINNAKNRIMAALLCIAMILSMIPGGIADLFAIRTEAADGLSLPASQLAFGANVIPSSLTSNSTFMDTYVKTNGASMNLNSLFTLEDSENANNASGTLSYKTIDGKKEKDWFAEYRWYPTEAQRQLLADSRYTLVYEGKLTPHWDKHVFASDHWSTTAVRLSKGDWTYRQNDYGHRTNGEIIFGAVSSQKNSGSAQAVKKSDSSISVNDGEFLTYAAYKLWSYSCGDPSVGGSTFYFVEEGNPTFNAYIEGGSYVNFGSASQVKGTLVMNFSENVRLADNDDNDDGLTVYLDAYYRSGSRAGTALTGNNRIAAELVSISGSQMRFEFTVPASINGSKTDIQITGLAADQPELWKTCDLNVYNGSGNLFTTVKDGSTSAITDIAGNPLSRYFTMSSKVVYDNVSPTVSRIDMTGNMISADSTKEPTSWEDNSVDLSAVFAGEGDTVGFKMYFSENITNAYDAVAVLSITDENGTPIELGVKSVSGNCITFHDLKITKQMLKAGNRVYITNIKNISNITDYAGNKLEDKGGNASTSSAFSLNYPALHAHQIYLDVDGPIITIGETIADANGGEYFTVPITIAEKTGASQISTVDDVPFSVVLSTDAGGYRGYYWYIDGNQTSRKYSYNSEYWKSATTDSTQCTFSSTADSYQYYLHIYLDPDTNYGYTANGGMDENGVYFNGVVSVTAGDWAGNTSTNSRAVSHQVDTVKPNFGGKDGFSKNPVLSVDFTNGIARVTKEITLTDNYCLEKATYTWYTRFNGETAYTAGTPVTLSASQLGSGLVKQVNKAITLEWTFDKASDSKRVGDAYLVVTYEDRPGNTATIQSEPFAFNFTKATSHFEITTGEESKPILRPSIVLSAPTWTSTTLENTPRTLIYIPYAANEDGTTNYWVYDPWNWEDGYDTSLPEGSWGEGSLNYTSDDLVSMLFTYYEEIRNSEENFQLITDYFPGRFYTLRGTIENDEGTFTSMDYEVGGHPDGAWDLYNYIKNSYGTMEVLFVTTASLEQWLDDYSDISPAAFADAFNFKAAETTVESVTLYLASSITYNVQTLSVRDATGADAAALLKYEQGNTTAASLDDVQITFQLSNVSDTSANYQYGFETIDFSRSKVELLFGTDVLAAWDLKKTGDGVQSVILEAGLCQQTGWYQLRVTVRDALTDTDQVFELDRYFLDTTQSELSLDTYYKNYNAEDEDVHIDSTFIVNKTGLEESYANGEEIILGLDTAPEGWILDTYLEFSRTKVDSYIMTDISQIRVTNVTYDEAYKAHLEAQELSYADTLSGPWIDSARTYSFRYIPVFTEEFAEGAYDNMVIPMLEGYNLLTYQIKNTNGTVTSKQIAVYVYGKSVEWELECTLESKVEGYINSATVTAVLPMDASFTLDDCHFGYTTTNNYTRPTSYTFVDDLDTTEFFLLDAYGNLSLQTIAVKDENGELIDIDGTGSEVYASERQGTDTGYEDGQTFCLEVSVQDKEREISPDDLFVIFDTYYSAVLQNVEVGTRHLNTEQLRVRIPFALNQDGTFRQNADGTYPVWEGYDISNYGIYRTQVLQVGGEEEYTGYVRFLIWGTWKHDAELDTDENAPSTRILTLASEDLYGNVGGYDCSYGYTNSYVDLLIGTPVAIMHDMYDPYGTYADRDAYAGELNIDAPLTQDQQLGIYSSVPLLTLEGYGAGKVKQYTTLGQAQRVFATTAPMIIEDGTYTFTATDLFGQNHQLELSLFDVFGELGVTAVFSTTQPTNQDVTVTVQATGLQDKIVSVTSSLGTVGTVDPADPRTASITVSENCTVTVLTEDGCERVIHVSNIDKVLGKAHIVYYDAFSNTMTGNESQAWDEVTALLVCDSEYIYATNGPDKYTFLPGDKAGDTYTFEYRDAAGNTGSITAVLPCDVVASPVPDTDAPSFRLNMYGMRFKSYELLTEIKNPETGAEISPEINGYKAQQFKFVLSIEDVSPTKVIVQPTGQAAPTDYASVNNGSTVENVSLTVSGRSATLQITENTQFDVYIIDEAGNVTALTDVVIGSVDTEAPAMYADYEVFTDADGLSGVSVKFLPADISEQLEIITPLSTDATAWLDHVTDEDGETLIPITRYGYIFRDNGTFTFTYQDAYGNIGSVFTEVKGLSNAAAVVKSVSWYGTKGNTTPEKSVPVNKDVVAQLDMSKAISRVTLYKYDPTAENNKGELVNDANVSVSFTGTNVYVTYAGNVDYQIVAEFTAAESGRKGYYTLQTVLCIDKVAPTVQVTGTELTENKRAMTVTFETDEPTLLSQNAAQGYTTVHSWVTKTNAPQQLQFSDATGNITVYELTENASVDTAYLTVHYSLTGSDADATDEPLDLELDSGDTIYIKTSKAADVELAGAAVGSAAANSWTKLTVPQSAGIHILVLIDTNTGDIVYDVLSSVPKDNVPPVITLASSTVIVNEDASYEDMLAAIQGGVTVTDDKDGDITEFRVTGYPDKVTAGLYTLTYHASDDAGNTSVISRILYIMAEGTPLLLVNGEAALPFDKVIISSGENISLQMQNFAGDLGSVVIKYRSGIKTAGQMKYSATTVENMSFSVTEPGHYTIYIRTQDRVEYVTYIYVEG